MSEGKMFAATYSECVQIGECEYKQIHLTKVFSYDKSISEIIDWLKSLNVKNPDINSVTISEVCE